MFLWCSRISWHDGGRSHGFGFNRHWVRSVNIVLRWFIKVTSHHDRHDGKMANIICLSKQNAQLEKDTTLMGADIGAALITKNACSFSATQVGKTMHLIFMHRFERQQVCMAISIVLTHRACSNCTVAVGTVLRKFFHQGLVEKKAWNALVSKVHA